MRLADPSRLPMARTDWRLARILHGRCRVWRRHVRDASRRSYWCARCKGDEMKLPAILLACVGIFAAAAVGAQSRSLADSLGQAAERSNRHLPRMVAKDLRQERIEVSGATLVYGYTHLTLDAQGLSAMNLGASQRPYIVPGLCSAPDTAQMLKEGARFRYVYRDKNGRVGGELTLTKSDC